MDVRVDAWQEDGNGFNLTKKLEAENVLITEQSWQQTWLPKATAFPGKIFGVGRILRQIACIHAADILCLVQACFVSGTMPPKVRTPVFWFLCLPGGPRNRVQNLDLVWGLVGRPPLCRARKPRSWRLVRTG